MDTSTLQFSGHHDGDTLLYVVDCGTPPTYAMSPWHARRTDLRYIMAVWQCANGGISEVPCIVYPDGRCDERSGQYVAWRIDKKATYLQPSTCPGQLKPIVIGAPITQAPTVVQCEMF